MKELSIEEKAMAYDEAIKNMRKFCNALNNHEETDLWVSRKDVVTDIEYYFPELKESEDERIRKVLIHIVKGACNKYDMTYHYQGVEVGEEKLLAWLEKQGEQETLCDKCRKEHPSHSCQDITALGRCAVEHEQKPTDNVEPKFKVGDWVVQGHNILKINFVGNEYYCFETVGGYVDDMLISEIDSQFHLWTIQDAKDGDVLATDSCIFIIQKLGDNNTAVKTYCTLYDDGDFDDGSILYFSFDIDSTKPATKEQRDALEKAMSDAGYTFDFDKKELKKIEQKHADNPESKFTAWSEEDEANFNEALSYIKDDALKEFIKSLKQRIGG